jgi:hypothetical protein
MSSGSQLLLKICIKASSCVVFDLVPLYTILASVSQNSKRGKTWLVLPLTLLKTMVKAMMCCCETSCRPFLSRILTLATHSAKKSIWYYMTCYERALPYKSKSGPSSLGNCTICLLLSKTLGLDYMGAVRFCLLKNRQLDKL